MRRSIVWFKTDLRLHDNETLVRASEQSDEIIPVYCFDESHFKLTEFGFLKTGSFRAQFLVEALADLDSNLRELGSGLIILKGKPEEEIARIARQFGAQKVFSKKEVSYEEKLTEETVENALWKCGCSLDTFSTSTLYHALDLPFTKKDIPDVFSSFRKKIEKEAEIRAIFQKPSLIKSPRIPEPDLPSLADLGLQPTTKDDRAAFHFIGGESYGMQRLISYFYETRAIATFKETRNGMIGADFSTKLSAWLALGCLSPREIYYELKKYESRFSANASTSLLVFELLWRDYFRFMVKKYQQKFFMVNGIKNQSANKLVHDPEILSKWINSETGSDMVDATMAELKLTGFISNRGRQNAARYLCHDLKLDWRYGAAYFEQQLIDYDVCNNWGNWAYVAGVGNDPKGSRYLTPEKTLADCDLDQSYKELWLAKA